MNKKKSTIRTKTQKLVIIAMLSSICIFLGLTGLGFIAIPPVKATIMHIPVIIGAILEGPLVGAIIGLIFGLFSMYQAVAAPGPISFLFLNPIIALIPRILIGIIAYYAYVVTLKSCKKSLKLSSLVGGLILGVLGFLAANEILSSFSISENICVIVGLIIGLLLFLLVIFVFTKVKHTNKEEFLSIGISAIVGTMVNTIGVLGLAYILYLDKYATALHMSKEVASASLLSVGLINGIPESFIAAFVTIPVILAIKKIRK